MLGRRLSCGGPPEPERVGLRGLHVRASHPLNTALVAFNATEGSCTDRTLQFCFAVI